ncbi:MAG: glyoxalase [Actinomycetia bacterium]|nr:glyoxalase [Actinomycetes bacterium]
MDRGNKLALVILACDEFEDASAFVAELFGWPKLVDADGYTEFDSGTVRVALYRTAQFEANFSSGAAGPRSVGGPPRAELYVCVDDLAGTVARAVRLGAQLLSDAGPRPWGETVAYLRMPGRHILALAAPAE